MPNLTQVLAAAFLAGAAPLAAQPPAPAPSPATAAPASLTLAFTGIARPEGFVMVALFDSEAGWRENRPVRTVRAAVAGASAQALFDGLPPGRYGVKSFHDMDGDGRMGTNPFGIPIEPFAFSNGARGAAGPAGWAEAAFELRAGANRHAIAIQ
ncbi:MAG TPA: DUF2141 domain-containing protein [Allosphingosinicella sp.]|nr:DUF2141 domain-containing protein [Allosphingosinicella sp.]